MSTTIDPKQLPSVTKRTTAWSLEERRAFRQLPIEERRRMLEEMAEHAIEHYSDEVTCKEREEWQSGDIIEY